MRSLRTRVFVTVAVIVSAATAAAAMLSRRATLVEERTMHIVVAQHVESLDRLAADVRSAYASGGWTAVQGVLRSRRGTRERFLALDGAGHIAASSDAALAAGDVQKAGADGTLTMLIRTGGTIGRLELKGMQTFPVRDSAGGDVGRVFVLPAPSGDVPKLSRPIVPPWAAATIGTVAIAVFITFALSGRILRPVSDLTDAAVRMREGDLSARVRPSGDDEIARLGRAFNEMAERLAHNERTKRQLVSDVAHELRSPVTNLRCGLEAIQDGLAAADPPRIDALHSETLLLQRLIGDLQDLALAESGGLALRFDTLDLDAVLHRAVGDEGVPPVSISVAPDARFVVADEGRVEQMVRNVLSNARRHTPSDGRIAIATSRTGDAVCLAVADTGRGIPPEHLPYVFDRFYRVDGSRDRATGGAGLGLAIVRRLAEAQGGSVSAFSAGADRGSTFSIHLPRATSPPDATMPRAHDGVADQVMP